MADRLNMGILIFDDVEVLDMAFYLVEKVCGKEIADETARYIEYPRGHAQRPRVGAP